MELPSCSGNRTLPRDVKLRDCVVVLEHIDLDSIDIKVVGHTSRKLMLRRNLISEAVNELLAKVEVLSKKSTEEFSDEKIVIETKNKLDINAPTIKDINMTESNERHLFMGDNIKHELRKSDTNFWFSKSETSSIFYQMRKEEPVTCVRSKPLSVRDQYYSPDIEIMKFNDRIIANHKIVPIFSETSEGMNDNLCESVTINCPSDVILNKCSGMHHVADHKIVPIFSETSEGMNDNLCESVTTNCPSDVILNKCSGMHHVANHKIVPIFSETSEGMNDNLCESVTTNCPSDVILNKCSGMHHVANHKIVPIFSETSEGMNDNLCESVTINCPSDVILNKCSGMHHEEKLVDNNDDNSLSPTNTDTESCVIQGADIQEQDGYMHKSQCNTLKINSAVNENENYYGAISACVKKENDCTNPENANTNINGKDTFCNTAHDFDNMSFKNDSLLPSIEHSSALTNVPISTSNMIKEYIDITLKSAFQDQELGVDEHDIDSRNKCESSSPARLSFQKSKEEMKTSKKVASTSTFHSQSPLAAKENLRSKWYHCVNKSSHIISAERGTKRKKGSIGGSSFPRKKVCGKSGKYIKVFSEHKFTKTNEIMFQNMKRSFSTLDVRADEKYNFVASKSSSNIRCRVFDYLKQAS